MPDDDPELDKLADVTHDFDQVEHDTEVKHTVAILLAARRLTLHAVNRLANLFAEKGWSDASFEAVWRVVRSESEKQAPPDDAPSLTLLANEMERQAVPFLREWAVQLAVAQNQARLSAAVRFDPAREPVDRKRPVVVVGTRRQLDDYWNRVLRPTLQAGRHDHARMVRGAVDKQDLGVGRYQVAGLHWTRNCSSRAACVTLLKDQLADLMARPLDVVVCDDLSLASPEIYEGQHPVTVAGNAVRHLGRAAGDLSALLIGFLPTDGLPEPFDATPPSAPSVMLRAQARVVTL